MIDPKERAQDEAELTEREPELEPEKVKDLATPERAADDVRGGQTSAGKQCYCGTM